ncbi:hypothetical protein DOTSEDRAFT_60584 [Dothistroma septosporum NZE10]|uniref:Enoyl reductase (ER) domain-containing protein n=1 Tax=Dothistroma septosporum (strain NZE10 / CBS 128990) TaxID=675120 RepID=N1Q0V5_DOTSN|nr:hypothetical protein DOTSEDRAFT_60584 [Dothistroma septosporum NZE10]
MTTIIQQLKLLRMAPTAKQKTNTIYQFPSYHHKVSASDPHPSQHAISPNHSLSEVRLKVLAVRIHRIVRSRASGTHYSTSTLPHIPVIDGVVTDPSGKLVYFASMQIGTLASHVNMPKHAVWPLQQGVGPVQVAASINPAMTRTTGLRKGFTYLILGATSASGGLAVTLARALGAGTVIRAARNEVALQALGLDRLIVIKEIVEDTDFTSLEDVDVVLDYVYGPLALHLFQSLKTPKSVQYVHIGSLSGTMKVAVPGEILRSKDLTIRGSGQGAWAMEAFVQTIEELLLYVPSLPEQEVEVSKFGDLEEGWGYSGPKKLDFVS